MDLSTITSSARRNTETWRRNAPIGIPCIRDRVVQATMKMLLEPILDPQFSEHSYGFRPGKDQQQAVAAAKRIVSLAKNI